MVLFLEVTSCVLILKTNPYANTLDEVKELSSLMGVVTTPVMNRLMKILTAFNKRLLVI